MSEALAAQVYEATEWKPAAAALLALSRSLSEGGLAAPSLTARLIAIELTACKITLKQAQDRLSKTLTH